MKRRVVLRADAARSIGFGHFVRTMALAAYLSRDFVCRVASFNPDLLRISDYQLGLISEASATPLHIEAADRDTYDAKFVKSLEPEDIVVLDNYYYNTEYQRLVRARCRALVCIDDVHDRHFVADVVMTFCPLQRGDFSLEEYTRFFGGPEWSFLRAPFLTPTPSRQSNHVDRVVLAMGGADPFRLTDRIVALLRELNGDISIDILAGPTVLVSHLDDPHIRVIRQADARQIVDLFDSADLGIFPASTVCMEAFARRLPVAAGHYVDNQVEIYHYGAEHGWFFPLGSLLDDVALRERLSHALSPGCLISPPPVDFANRRNDIIEIFKSL
ncbi:MAG: hypothetical protein ACI4AK_08795 [Lepagella sp.]